MAEMKNLKFTVTDYWDKDFSHRPYRSTLRDSKDRGVSTLEAIEKAIALANAKDGDQIEIIVRKTGKRPFGNRRVRYVAAHTYERES